MGARRFALVLGGLALAGFALRVAYALERAGVVCAAPPRGL